MRKFLYFIFIVLPAMAFYAVLASIYLEKLFGI